MPPGVDIGLNEGSESIELAEDIIMREEEQDWMDWEEVTDKLRGARIKDVVQT